MDAMNDDRLSMESSVDLICGETGHVLARVPERAIYDCAHQGPCDDDVAYWLTRTEWVGDDDDLRCFLKGYGAWDDLQTCPQETLRGRALWVLCGNERDNRQE